MSGGVLIIGDSSNTCHILLSILCTCCSAGCPNELVSLLAKPDPLGYFNLVELLCRMAPWDTWEQDSSTLLRQGDTFRVLHALYSLMDLAVEDLRGAESDQADQQQQQRPWWQLWKAVASTYASWTKAYTKTLRAVASGRATTAAAARGALAQQSGAEKEKAQEEAAAAERAARGAAAGWAVSPHDEELVVFLGVLSKMFSPVGRAIISPAAVGADNVRLELLLLLWGARLVAATREHLVPGPTAAFGMVGRGEASLISSSTEGTGRDSSSSTERASKASNGPCSSSTSMGCSSVSTNADQAGIGTSTSGDGKVEEGVGTSPAAPSRAGQAAAAMERDCRECVATLMQP